MDLWGRFKVQFKSTLFRAKKEHAVFHKCATEIVKMVDAGNIQKAETMIDAHSNYRDLSTKVVTKIRKLRDVVESNKLTLEKKL